MIHGTASQKPSHRSGIGQVFTPRPVADWMVRWACADRPRRILDPALGLGVFVNAIEDLRKANGHFPRPRIDAYEIDVSMMNAICTTPRDVDLRCRCRDFITAPIRDRFDAIIANPPYVRHHEMNYSEAVLQRYDRLCGRRLSRMTNLYGLFLIRIWNRLAPGGRAAVITPAEWLNADFGRPIKAHLLEQNAIEAILHFDHTAQVFDKTLTTAAITLIRRDRHKNAPITLAAVPNLKALGRLNLEACRQVAPADLCPTEKWSPMFSSTSRPRSVVGPRLSEIGRCMRGIATGANHFFTLRESDRSRFGIDRRDLVPCIVKAHQVPNNILTKAHISKLIEADHRVYLLRPRRRLSPAVKEYLLEGQRLGIDRRYLPSHRPVWFRPEHREPAPIWVSVFARGGFRFILNRAAALNLTAFHAIYLHEPNRSRTAALYKYLSSDAAATALIAHRRIYADGLLKLEPRDVMAIPIPPALCEQCRPALTRLS